MVEETLVKETLTKEMIEAGATLTHRLDRARLTITASLWLYLADENIWRLIIASPMVRKNGPKRVYRKIQSVLSRISNVSIDIQLKDITVIPDNAPLIALLRTAVTTGKHISPIRFSRSTINGHFIEDALIYRII